jgi:hypothetical protein
MYVIISPTAIILESVRQLKRDGAQNQVCVLGRRVLAPPRPHLETLSLSYLLHCYTGIVRALRYVCMLYIIMPKTKVNKTRELKGEKESSSRRRRGLKKGEGRRKK